MTLRQLHDLCTGNETNAIMPLFWQKGDSLDVVEEEMRRIAEAGIREVILEARPHPDFLGAGWWRDVDEILSVAHELGMRVWFFDDDTFPTGHANGALVGADPSVRRRFLKERHTDAVGPVRGSSFIVDRRQFWGPTADQDTGTLLAVIAYPRAESSEEQIGDAVDLTANVVDGVVHWDVPDGWWRVMFVTVTSDGGSDRHADHIDYLDPASTQLLIDNVYEKIFDRYPTEFGRTIAGFFSDEPGLYNDPQTFDFQSRLGKAAPLPWNDELADALRRQWESDFVRNLPKLWFPAQGDERAVRYAFMDTVSRLYGENFSGRLGSWCRDHGVEYIGHVIEDNGAHARLGPGAGHYFRAMTGQDMAGIDIIGGQVIPGFSQGPFANMSGNADGVFFHFGLAKLASSCAHLDERKRGRSMCETIGAYGWYAGLRLFRWLTNHLLVRGVTHVVPHAFSPSPFPDLDCPPHFYAQGHNPQFQYQHLLSTYTNRLSELLRGEHIASFAVLYHADAEWLGGAQASEEVLRILMQAQFDADIVPVDALSAAAEDEGRLRLANESFDALIVPWSEYLPARAAEQLLRLSDAGVTLAFVDEVPRVAGDKGDALRERFHATTSSELAATVEPLTNCAVRIDSKFNDLRVLRVSQGDADIVMFFNESTRERLKARAWVPRAGEAVLIDVDAAAITSVHYEPHPDGTSLQIDLVPGEAAVFAVGDPAAWSGLPLGTRPRLASSIPLSGHWRVSVLAADAPSEEFLPWRELAHLCSLSSAEHLPAASGTFRYETEFSATKGSRGVLDLGEVYEIARVWLNGVDLGTRIAPPYRFALPADGLQEENQLRIEVVNTLAKQERDFFSAFAQQDPTGLMGPVAVIEAEKE